MIKKQKPIEVPASIRYISQWNNFSFSKFPAKCIINKQIPGCGFTEYCLNGSEFVILASPRIMLINNKADQHPDVFLVKNEMDKDPAIDKDLNKNYKNSGKATIEDIEETKRKNSAAFEKIKIELKNYYNKCLQIGKPMKILVTYDSYHIVKDLLSSPEFGNIFHLFYTVIDEFQSILHDARFKSDTEMQFMNNLKSSHSAIFVSATPMMEEYLNMLDEFNGLPYFELDWKTQDSTRVIKPNLDVYLMRSVGEAACKVIKTYIEKKFEEVVVQRYGQPLKIQSTEAVLYVNSVNHITSIINKMELKPDQVLILCSNTDENKRKIKNRLGSSFVIGKIPLKNEPRKMFTFCTRTVYLGADFYSDNARTFIFSDANVDSLAVDISEDLPQILGRQRLEENPWKNSATFYYRTSADYRTMTKEDFNNKIDSKKKKTEDLLSVYYNYMVDADNSTKYNLAEKYQKDARNSNYRDDYVAVNLIHVGKHTILKPVWNNLVLVNEIRAFRIQQIDYKDRFSVFSNVNNKINLSGDYISAEVAKFFNTYDSFTTIHDKLKFLCEVDLSQEVKDVIVNQIPDNDEIKSYYINLGPQRLYSLGYNTTRIKKELGIITFDMNNMINDIYLAFNVGDRLSLVDIKSKLSLIYKYHNYNKNPKATDIQDYFEIKPAYITSIDVSRKKKQSRGFELIKKLR